MIKDIFLIVFSDSVVQTLVVGTVMVAGILIAAADYVRGRW